jgi:hypothetical protein
MSDGQSICCDLLSDAVRAARDERKRINRRGGGAAAAGSRCFASGASQPARAISALLSDCAAAAAAAGADVIRKNCRRWSQHRARIQLKSNIFVSREFYLICEFDSEAVRGQFALHAQKKVQTCAEPNATDQRPCADWSNLCW